MDHDKLGEKIHAEHEQMTKDIVRMFDVPWLKLEASTSRLSSSKMMITS